MANGESGTVRTSLKETSEESSQLPLFELTRLRRQMEATSQAETEVYRPAANWTHSVNPSELAFSRRT